MSSIPDRLTSLFDKHRIVFWYDEQQELRDDFEGLNLKGVEKQVVENNEFGIKVLVYHKQPNQKFLLYFPPDVLNQNITGFLDLQLCQGELKTDPLELMLQELDMSRDHGPLIEAHLSFFKSKDRKEKFKELFKEEDTDSKSG